MTLLHHPPDRPHEHLPDHLRDGAVVVALPYPSAHFPDQNPFIHAFGVELTRQGLPVSVVAPQRRPARHRLVLREDMGGIHVRRPPFWSPGARRPLRGPRLRLSHRNFTSATVRAAGDLPTPSFFWGHFLRPSGVAAIELGRRFGRPAFVVLGETYPRHTHDPVFDAGENARSLSGATGVVAVSHELAETARERYGVERHQLVVFPNAVDVEQFVPGDRLAARRALGLPKDAFVVVYVGRLDDNKGAGRVATALDRVGGDAVGLFVGRGPRSLPTRQPTITGPVRHDEVVTRLQAADVFVLPSLREGSPNAVLEAMACGLALVVSDRPFMRAIADTTTATFVDPTQPGQIADALVDLRDDAERRERMGAAARARAEAFPLSRRVADLLRWIDPRVAGFTVR